MNVLGLVFLISVGVVIVTVGVDVGQQIWAEKQKMREVHEVKIKEAETLLYAAISERFEGRPETSNTIELRVVALPQKPAGGRHRLSAA